MGGQGVEGEERPRWEERLGFTEGRGKGAGAAGTDEAAGTALPSVLLVATGGGPTDGTSLVGRHMSACTI